MSTTQRLILILVMASYAWAAPIVREVTPPTCGGSVDAWSADHRFAVGHANWAWNCDICGDRVFIWSEDTGPCFLDRLVQDFPEIDWQWWPSIRLHELPDEYVLTMHGMKDRLWHAYIVRLPRDLRALFDPADLDHDGDVDQQDFGIRQRIGGDMTEFIQQIGGPR